jgi:hypothetical protein
MRVSIVVIALFAASVRAADEATTMTSVPGTTAQPATSTPSLRGASASAGGSAGAGADKYYYGPPPPYHPAYYPPPPPYHPAYGPYGPPPAYGPPAYGGGYYPCDTIYNQRECDMHASNSCHWHDGVARCQNH